MTIPFGPLPTRLPIEGRDVARPGRRSDLENLATAIHAGSLVAAKNAIASINIDTGIAAKTGRASTSNADQFHSDLETLFDAVESGDIEAARQALAALTRDVPGYGPRGGSLTLITSWSITISFGTPAPSTAGTATGADPLSHSGDDGPDADTVAAASTPAAAASDPMEALIHAVGAGDLTAARQALQLLRSALAGIRGHHGHHGHHGVRRPESAPDADSGRATGSSRIGRPGATLMGGPTPAADGGTPRVMPTVGSVDVPAPTL